MADAKAVKNKPLFGNAAQASLEISFAMICALLVLFGSFRIFLWVNEQMANREEDYENQRVLAGSVGSFFTSIEVDESRYPKLDIFGSRKE